MTREELVAKIAETKQETHDALTLIIGELNRGQRHKLAKNEQIKALLDRYGVEID